MYGISPWAVWFLVAFAAFILVGSVIHSRYHFNSIGESA